MRDSESDCPQFELTECSLSPRLVIFRAMTIIAIIVLFMFTCMATFGNRQLALLNPNFIDVNIET